MKTKIISVLLQLFFFIVAFSFLLPHQKAYAQYPTNTPIPTPTPALVTINGTVRITTGGVYTSGANIVLVGPTPGFQVSGGGGGYSFNNRLQGVYTISVGAASIPGYAFAYCLPACSGNVTSNITVDIYIQPIVSISGLVRSTAGGVIGGVVVHLGLGPDAPQNYTSSGIGYYQFVSLNPGNYLLSVPSPPAGYAFDSCSPGCLTGYITAYTNVDIYLRPLHSISGNIYVDTDANGARSAGESTFGPPALPTGTVTVHANPGGFSTSVNVLGNYNFGKVFSQGTTYTITTTITTVNWIPTTTLSVSVGASDVSGQDLGIAPPYQISGLVTMRDGGSVPQSPAPTVSINPAVHTPVQVNSAGIYDFGQTIPAGTYSLTLNSPAGYAADGTNPRNNITVPPDNAVVNFTMGKLYTISGDVYVDVDKNGTKNGPDYNYNSSIVVTAQGAVTLSYNGNGGGNPGYRIQSTGTTYLFSGSYSVSYAPTTPYFLTSLSPQTVKVGSGTSPCSPLLTSASCDPGGNITNLNFGIANLLAWFQDLGADMRIDLGFKDPAPLPFSQFVSITNATNTSPGVLFVGDGSYSFGVDGAHNDSNSSTKKWIVSGNSSYPEYYTPVNPGVIRTSYAYMKKTADQNSSIVQTPLSASCNTSGGCTLPTTKGVYTSSGPTYVNASTLNGGNYIFLINGDLTVKGNISVPLGSNSTATFSVSGNIFVDKNMGEAAPASTTSDMDGLYSANGSFIVQGVGNSGGLCQTGIPDKRLNIYGSVVANAALLGGTFQYQRDLCGGDTNPTVYISPRLDMILNAPDFIKHTTLTWQEVAP